MKRQAHKGFTLIELLVVIAIIGILIALLVPAIVQVRESASRVQCKNNLRQIGLALHSYHDRWESFPSGYVSTVGPGGPADDQGPGWGWSALILPYLEKNNLSQQIDFTKGITDPANATARTTVLKVFLCPSDAGKDTFTVDKLGDASSTYSTPLLDVNSKPVEVAHSNYVGIFGNPEITPDPGFLDTTNPDRSIVHQGMFYRNSRVRIAQVTDGTTNTLFVGERSSNLAYATWTGSVTGGQVPPKIPDPFGFGPEGAPILTLGHTGNYLDVPPHTPNSPVNHVDDFWSRHSLGVNFLFVDGSVRNINDQIDPTVWWSLGTRAGAEFITNLPD